MSYIQKPNSDFDWRKFHFITMVQTGLIHNLVEIETRKSKKLFDGDGNKSVYLTLIDMNDAFYAAEHIPEDMDILDAAKQFLKFACENLRDDDYVHDSKAWYLRNK
jgi:hypothetical protein